ncbi:YbaB/EbfC family nucleoid-associated protein [Streptomyces luteolifulvus]|jgi:DNA-binding protein YbaB|nr:YbaB/EbfC family nucleoid-associated protein [Streptomyces luteolifulvus]
MDGTIKQRLAQAMEELKATEAAVAEAERELRGSSCTVKSRDRSVEVTVDAQGGLVALRFLDSAYRDMGPAELAASVLEAAERARTTMARQVMQVLGPLTQASQAVPELSGVAVDWVKIFGPGVMEESDDTAIPPSQRRLRDEINEDGEE